MTWYRPMSALLPLQATCEVGKSGQTKMGREARHGPVERSGVERPEDSRKFLRSGFHLLGGNLGLNASVGKTSGKSALHESR